MLNLFFEAGILVRKRIRMGTYSQIPKTVETKKNKDIIIAGKFSRSGRRTRNPCLLFVVFKIKVNIL